MIAFQILIYGLQITAFMLSLCGMRKGDTWNQHIIGLLKKIYITATNILIFCHSKKQYVPIWLLPPVLVRQRGKTRDGGIQNFIPAITGPNYPCIPQRLIRRIWNTKRLLIER